LYFNLPKTQINRLWHIQNSLARTVANTSKYSNITPVLKSLHWLKIEQCIQYKLISLTYKNLTTSQPTYLHNLISLQPDNNTRSSDVVTLAYPSTTSSLFVNQFHLFMLISIHPFHLHFLHPSPLHSFTLNSKLTFLVNLFRHRSLTGL